MPGIPKYLSWPSTSARESSDMRRMRLENESLRNVIEESIVSFETHNEKNSFHYYEELKSKVCDISLPADWTVLLKENYVNFVSERKPSAKNALCY